MHFINSNATEIKEINPYKKVEKIGRICYKSEDKITEDSWKSFVGNLIKRQHFAMLEHARLFFLIHINDEDRCAEVRGIDLMNKLSKLPAVHTGISGYKHCAEVGVGVSLSHLYNDRWSTYPYSGAMTILDAFRIVIEEYFEFDFDDKKFSRNQVLDNLKEFHNLELGDIEFRMHWESSDTPTWSYPDCEYVTVKFDCDRGVSHELVRHRCAVAQSSTRYVNYSKDKFGNGDIAFVYPHEYGAWDDNVKELFEKNLQECEDTYNYMTSNGMSPQQSRAVLPNALATEVVLTMNLAQWKHFIDLRYKGTTGAPHPDMQDVASTAYHDILHSYLEKISCIYFVPFVPLND